MIVIGSEGRKPTSLREKMVFLTKEGRGQQCVLGRKNEGRKKKENYFKKEEHRSEKEGLPKEFLLEGDPLATPGEEKRSDSSKKPLRGGGERQNQLLKNKVLVYHFGKLFMNVSEE